MSLMIKVLRSFPRSGLTSIRNFSSQPIKAKDVFRDDLYQIKKDRVKKAKHRLMTSNPDPLSPIKLVMKASFVAFLASTAACVAYGAYDPGFRRQLRTTYPYAALWLDMLMEKENQEEDVVINQREGSKEAVIYRQSLKAQLSPFKEELRDGLLIESSPETKESE